MKIRAVIGKNFGDESKGLAVACFALKAKNSGDKCLVIRHNGGAQAGHTVDSKDKRFIFHQLGSGSFYGSDTFWADTYLPDLYKLPEELHDFQNLCGFKPNIYSFGDCRCVYIDDILINMALELSRGDKRHGSCGMGINESVERSKDLDFRITLKDIKGFGADKLFSKLKFIRNNYGKKHLHDLGLDLKTLGEYGELLGSDNVLLNVSEVMCRSAENVQIVPPNFLKNYDEIIFEGAQGLLLDENYKKYAPHLTTSRTGLHNPCGFVDKYLWGNNIESVYITRSYVTRHGRGPLPCEGLMDSKKWGIIDKTNIPNDWQETLRFAPHQTQNEFVAPVIKDINSCKFRGEVSLFITHLNETKGNILCENTEIPVEDWVNLEEIKSVFNNFYYSNSPFAEDFV